MLAVIEPSGGLEAAVARSIHIEGGRNRETLRPSMFDGGFAVIGASVRLLSAGFALIGVICCFYLHMPRQGLSSVCYELLWD